MTNRRDESAPRQAPDTRAEVHSDVASLLGLRPTDAGDVPEVREIDDSQTMTATAMDEGELDSHEPGSIQPDVEHLESLADDEGRAGETDDSEEAADEGLAWIAPMDPPVVPDRESGGPDPLVAAGFGSTAEAEPFDADHHGELLYASDEHAARVEEALRADARTSVFADRIEVEVDGDRAILSGSVDDLEDEDSALAVTESVTGVAAAESQLTIVALESPSLDER